MKWDGLGQNCDGLGFHGQNPSGLGYFGAESIRPAGDDMGRIQAGWDWLSKSPAGLGLAGSASQWADMAGAGS